MTASDLVNAVQRSGKGSHYQDVQLVEKFLGEHVLHATEVLRKELLDQAGQIASLKQTLQKTQDLLAEERKKKK